MQDNELRYRLINLVEAGKTPPDIAQELGITVTKASRWCNAYNKAKIDDALDTFVDFDDAVVARLLSDIQDEAPESVQGEVAKAASSIAKSKTALDSLQLSLINSAALTNNKLRSMIAGVDTVDDLKVVTETLCILQTAFFNKPVTQVNIQNNAGQPQYGEFLSDKPKDY